MWCSNDYLGMGLHPAVIEAMRCGGQAWRRRWRHPQHCRQQSSAGLVEAELADLHGKAGCLVFTSGWMSNLAAISTIGSLLPDCLILSDALNHNSMIEGIKRSGAERQIFRHNDLEHLEDLLKRPAASGRS